MDLGKEYYYMGALILDGVHIIRVPIDPKKRYRYSDLSPILAFDKKNIKKSYLIKLID